MAPRDAFDSLNRITGLAPMSAPVFDGVDPIMVTPFRVAEAAAASLGFGAAVASEIWQLRGGERQTISIDLSAAAASLLSFMFLKRDGQSCDRPAATAPSVGLYRCQDGRWIHLHGGFPRQWLRMLDLLNSDDTRPDVAEAAARWNSFALEESIANHNKAGAVVRLPEEWKESVQGRALANTPPIVLRKLGDAPPLRLRDTQNPLDAIRVLDLTRVLAGPTCGRTLASYGAEVLNVRAERLDTIELYALDTGHGKRSIFLDLVKTADAETLRRLVRGAHIFVDSYRPGALSKLGFSPASLAHIAQGITYVSVSCYGQQGPWSERRGWEQLAQSATGIAHVQGEFSARRKKLKGDIKPQLIPAAVCDYITGYLAAAGAAAALLRRIREGGSWHVQVSLSATAMWLQSLGLVEAARVPETWTPEGLVAYLKSCDTGAGRLEFFGPVVNMSKTQPVWRRPTPAPSAEQTSWNEYKGFFF